MGNRPRYSQEDKRMFIHACVELGKAALKFNEDPECELANASFLGWSLRVHALAGLVPQKWRTQPNIESYFPEEART